MAKVQLSTGQVIDFGDHTPTQQEIEEVVQKMGVSSTTPQPAAPATSQKRDLYEVADVDKLTKVLKNPFARKAVAMATNLPDNLPPQTYIDLAKEAGVAGMHYLNQVAFNAPRSLLNKADIAIPEAQTKVGNVVAHGAGIVGALSNPVGQAFTKLTGVAKVGKAAAETGKVLSGMKGASAVKKLDVARKLLARGVKPVAGKEALKAAGVAAAGGFAYAPTDDFFDIKQRATQGVAAGVTGGVFNLGIRGAQGLYRAGARSVKRAAQRLKGKIKTPGLDIKDAIKVRQGNIAAAKTELVDLTKNINKLKTDSIAAVKTGSKLQAHKLREQVVAKSRELNDRISQSVQALDDDFANAATQAQDDLNKYIQGAAPKLKQETAAFMQQANKVYGDLLEDIKLTEPPFKAEAVHDMLQEALDEVGRRDLGGSPIAGKMLELSNTLDGLDSVSFRNLHTFVKSMKDMVRTSAMQGDVQYKSHETVFRTLDASYKNFLDQNGSEALRELNQAYTPVVKAIKDAYKKIGPKQSIYETRKAVQFLKRIAGGKDQSSELLLEALEGTNLDSGSVFGGISKVSPEYRREVHKLNSMLDDIAKKRKLKMRAEKVKHIAERRALADDATKARFDMKQAMESKIDAIEMIRNTEITKAEAEIMDYVAQNSAKLNRLEQHGAKIQHLKQSGTASKQVIWDVAKVVAAAAGGYGIIRGLPNLGRLSAGNNY